MVVLCLYPLVPTDEVRMGLGSHIPGRFEDTTAWTGEVVDDDHLRLARILLVHIQEIRLGGQLGFHLGLEARGEAKQKSN